jgi:hypothetical protein
MGSAAYDRYWRAPPTLAAHAQRLLALYEGLLGEAVGRPSERAIMQPATGAA